MLHEHVAWEWLDHLHNILLRKDVAHINMQRAFYFVGSWIYKKSFKLPFKIKSLDQNHNLVSTLHHVIQFDGRISQSGSRPDDGLGRGTLVMLPTECLRRASDKLSHVSWHMTLTYDWGEEWIFINCSALARHTDTERVMACAACSVRAQCAC